jgi:hypothetical protein
VRMAYSTYVERKMHRKFSLSGQTRRGHLGNLCVDKMLCTKWILKVWDVRM